MRRILLVFIIAMVSFETQAKWVERNVIQDVQSEDPKEIPGMLTMFVETLNYLNADNLTAPSRLIVKKFTGRLSNFVWENDSECAVKDPSLVAEQRVSQTQAEFYYEKKPQEVFTMDYFNAPAEPCDGGAEKRLIHRRVKSQK